MDAEHAHLAAKTCRTLVDLCASQTPVVMTWATYLGGDLGTEVTTAAVIIEHLSTQQAYVRYCGFGHWVELAEVRTAAPFATIHTYES